MPISKIITDSLTAGGINQSVLDSTSQYTGFKNRLINGNFSVWQRGITARTAMSNSAPIIADRWNGNTGYQNANHQRVTISSPPTGLNSQYAIRVSSSTTAEASGGTRMDLSQKIESLNCMDLAGQTVTLSFWIKFSAATCSSVANTTDSAFGYWCARLQYNTTTTDSAIFSDVGDGACTAIAVTGTNAAMGTSTQLTIANGSLPTTWTKYSLTVTVPAGIKNLTPRLTFNQLGNTAVADTVYFDVAEVQLERGATATAFDYRPYSTELSLAQRYALFIGTQSGGYTLTFGMGFSNGGTQAWRVKFFNPVPMRSTPTISFTNIQTWNSNGGAQTLSSINTVYQLNGFVEVDVSAGGTIATGGYPVSLQTVGSGGASWLLLSADF